MRIATLRTCPVILLFVTLGVVATGCVTSRPLQIRSNVFEFLYPDGQAAATPATVVDLKVPLRVGLAFAPSESARTDSISEQQKQQLLERIAVAFRGGEFVQSVEVIPSHYLARGGSFAELDRLAAAFGLDLMTLVSIDQRQFLETTNKSWAYLTVLGAFVVRGEKNETRTLMDAVIYDIPSRALLFRAAGESSISGKSTPITVERRTREASESGLDAATDELIGQMEIALAGFREQVKTGTVRGPGTPAVQLSSTGGRRIGTGGAGAVGPILLLVAALLLYLAGRFQTPR